MLKAKDETGLQICGVVDSVHWKQTLSDPDPAVRAAGLEGLKTALRECKQYGGNSVLLVPAVVNKHVPMRMLTCVHRRRFARLCRLQRN